MNMKNKELRIKVECDEEGWKYLKNLIQKTLIKENIVFQITDHKFNQQINEDIWREM